MVCIYTHKYKYKYTYKPLTSNHLSLTGILFLNTSVCVFFFFLNIFIDYAITVVPFPPLHSILLTPLPPTFPPYSSCPWIILKSSLASTFPILFLPSPCLFSTYHL